jgi:hypothetical protein
MAAVIVKNNGLQLIKVSKFNSFLNLAKMFSRIQVIILTAVVFQRLTFLKLQLIINFGYQLLRNNFLQFLGFKPLPLEPAALEKSNSVLDYQLMTAVILSLILYNITACSSFKKYRL